AGMRTRECLDCLAATRERLPNTPLVPMTYASLLEAYGWERFAGDAAAAGATSMILADLPAGEHPELRRIQMVAPTSTDERLALGVVVGTAAVEAAERGPDALGDYVSSLRAAVDSAAPVGSRPTL